MYILSGPSIIKHGRLEAYHIFPNLVCTDAVSAFIAKWCHKLHYWAAGYVIFSTIKDPKKFMMPNEFFDHLQLFLLIYQSRTPYLSIADIMASGNFISQNSVLLFNLFSPFIVQVNCLCDLNFFANSHPSAMNLKKVFSSTFFLTAGKNNFWNKLPNLNSKSHPNTIYVRS